MIALGCRSTKRLKENESLVTKLTVNGIDDRFSSQAEGYVSLDIRPNSPFNLFLYNNFSKKGKYKIGEAPHLLDSALVDISADQIRQFLNYKGFLNAAVTSEMVVENKRAEVIFTAKPGTEFKFRKISFNIPDSAIKAIYLNNRRSFTHVDSGKRYDVDSLAYEREKIYVLMKQNGYYDFVRQYVRPVVDTNFNDGVADVELGILNPSDSTKHQTYELANTFIRIQPSSGIISKDMIRDSTVVDSQYRFYDYSHFFKPKKLTSFIFLKKGDLYNIDNSELTTQRLFDINVFKNVSVNFRKTADSTNRLVGLIDMLPLKQKSNRLDGEYTFNSSLTGINTGLTYQNRNFLGGAELFEVKLRVGVQFDKNKSGNLTDRLLSSDYQLGASLTFPRLIVPFSTPDLVKNGVPRTRVGVSYQIYKLTDKYLRRSSGSTLTYEWEETAFKQHAFTPINIQFAQGNINENLVDNLINSGNLFFIYTLRSQLISSSYYSYTFNLPKLTTLNNFKFFNGGIEIGGNSAALLGKINNKKNTDDQNLLFGVPYYQFAKLTADVRWYRFLGGDRQFIFRLNGGVGYSYSNVKSLPFDKTFFAGGSSGIRGWQARTLGPGNYNRASLSTDTLRTNLRNLDQVGDIKLEGNLEYRFKLLDNFIGGKLKGATFVDFGNIWQLRDNSIAGKSGTLKFDKLFSQIAISPGFGLRYDLSFFVIRIDAGFKLKDPQFSGSDQYVYKYWFNKSAKNDFNNKYNLSNAPDRYSITQIQFGIGMPF
ncbi:MAG: BamA/TamA family outer membrane protein [Pelobium sp.]